jgi:hypothetical protein
MSPEYDQVSLFVQAKVFQDNFPGMLEYPGRGQ